MSGFGDDGRSDAGGAGMEQLESELAMLVRCLEAVQRRRSYPLERASYLLIGLVEREGPQSVGEIAHRLLLDASTVTRQVSVLADAGLVRKQANPADARSALVHATDHGLQKVCEMRKARFKRLELLFDGWSDSDREECGRMISRLNRSLVTAVSRDDKTEF